MHLPEMTPGELENKIEKARKMDKKRQRRFIRRHPEFFTKEEIERAAKQEPTDNNRST